MGRKSKCSKELKLSIVKSYLNKDGSYEILAKEANVHFTTVRKWIKKYVAFGESAFDSTNTNASYTKEFKEHVVLDYLNGAGAYIDLAVKYKIPSNSTIEKWVEDYNSYIELKDYIPGGKEIYMAKSRKVAKDERIEIAKYCIEHNLDYVGTAKLYETTYANVFNWVKKYRENGEEGLNDNRGRKKLVEEDNSEVATLKRQLKQMERERNRALLEVELLKKLDEIERRRFTEQVNMKENMKQSKK